VSAALLAENRPLQPAADSRRAASGRLFPLCREKWLLPAFP
jgi:hypothetical protein